jgi:hypothetical protein
LSRYTVSDVAKRAGVSTLLIGVAIAGTFCAVLLRREPARPREAA